MTTVNLWAVDLDRVRKELQALEEIEVKLELYAAEHQLIAELAGDLFGSADMCDVRCNKAFEALVWLQQEMQAVRASLAAVESTRVF